MPTITYNIPTDKAADVVAALRKHYSLPNATPAQLNDMLAADLKAKVRKIYADYMKASATYDVVLD